MPAQLESQIRRNDNEGKEIEGNGADRVFKRLAGRVDGVEKVQDTKVWIFVQKQEGRMQQRHRERGIAGPVVQAKIVEPSMRPGTMRAIPKGHEHSKEEVQRNRANRSESDVGGEV